MFAFAIPIAKHKIGGIGTLFFEWKSSENRAHDSWYVRCWEHRAKPDILF
jgi:hypothetical protein